MRDIDTFTKLLGLTRPWSVDKVSLNAGTKRIDIYLRHRHNARFRCPECERVLPLYDHIPSRGWRHLDHGSWITWLHARLPRVSCPLHGVRHVEVPWAPPGVRFSLAFERHTIDTLLESDVLGASRLLRISWDQAWGIMERAVERGMQAKQRRIIKRIGVDEKAVATRHRYVTLVSDLDRGTVEYIADDRKIASLDGFWESLSVRQKAGIEAVAMDMWEPFITSTHKYLPRAEAKIVFDRFHIMQHMTRAVDEVRKAEHRQLHAEGDDTLLRTKYIWLFSEENLPEKYVERFALLRAMELKTGRAWSIKESLRILWQYRSKGWAMRFWTKWYFWATHSQLKPVVRVARMLKSHLANVLTYCDHQVTNATSEGLNSKIQTVKKMPTVTATAST